MPADPDSLTVAPCPMSRPPDIMGSARVITRAVGSITPIIRSVSRICAVILIASGYTECNSQRRKEQAHPPFPYRFRSISGGDRLLLRARNNVRFHIIVYGLDGAFTHLKSESYSISSLLV
jgi:hypothetical protein